MPEVQARDLEAFSTPMVDPIEHSLNNGGNHEAPDNPFKDVLDAPYANEKTTPLDFIMVSLMGCLLGALAIPYIWCTEKIPLWWMQKAGDGHYPDAKESLEFQAGSVWWILICWGGCTGFGVLKVILGLDAYPSFITEVKHQENDPVQSVKVFICCIASLCAGATLGPEAGLGSIGGAIGHTLAAIVNKTLCRRQDSKAKDHRRRIYTLAGIAAAFGSILPAPYIAIMLVSELSSAGTEHYKNEEAHRELAGGRSLPLKIMFYLAPAATFSFSCKYAIDKANGNVHPQIPIGMMIPYDEWSSVIAVGLGVVAAFVGLCFLLFSAITKAIVTKIGNIVERCSGKRTRIIWNASFAGLIIGVLIWYMPLVSGSGRDTVQPAIKDAKYFSTQLLLFSAIGKIVAFSTSQAGGLVGGLVFPLIFIAELAGEVSARTFNVERSIAIPVMLAAVPASVITAPLSMLLLPVGMLLMGPLQTVPIFMGVMTANGCMVGTGFLQNLMARADARAQQQQQKRGASAS